MNAAPIDLQALVRGHLAGRALNREFYTDPAIFERDMECILLKHWFCATHASALARPGDFVTVDLGAESVIVVRTAEGEIRALLNVCRHRGSRLCNVQSGRAPAGRFTCPYHAWSYDLDGQLLAARSMPESFDRHALGLKSLPVRIVEGLIFTTFTAEPLDFGAAEVALTQSAGVHGWGRAKVAHRELYSIEANWKLAIENYMECYHCQPAHPEYSRGHTLAQPAAQVRDLERAGRARSEALGIAIPDIDQYGSAALPGSEYVSVFRSALLGAGGTEGDRTKSAGLEGRRLEAGGDTGIVASWPRVAPLMGGFSDYDGNSTYFDVGPLSDFLAYADHGVIYRFIPRAAQRTDMEVIWLVDDKAVEGEDYRVDELTSLWKTTSLEDKKIVEMNQAGVNSRYFEPGPYSLQEAYARRFVDWYLSEHSDGATGA